MMDIIGTNLQLYGTDAAAAPRRRRRRQVRVVRAPLLAAALTATGASTTLARFSVSQFSNKPRQ